MKMHADEKDVDTTLVRRLIDAQFPQWSGLSLARVPSDGTDNAIYRLGHAMAVRMPRYPAAAGQAQKEAEWLPQLAPRLPLDVPVPLALGEPGEGYPWCWAVVRWIEGDAAYPDRIADPVEAAVSIARFVAAMQGLDASHGPRPGDHNFGRGEPLADRDAEVRDALGRIGDVIDVDAATAAWDASLAVPVWDGAPAWIHGDLQAANVLARDGRLVAVIDFGGLGVGDPACDVMAAWTFLPREARAVFRSELGVDDASWERGRGWALSMALIALPYYRDTNPSFAGRAIGWIEEVLSDRDR